MNFIDNKVTIQHEIPDDLNFPEEVIFAQIVASNSRHLAKHILEKGYLYDVSPFNDLKKRYATQVYLFSEDDIINMLERFGKSQNKDRILMGLKASKAPYKSVITPDLAARIRQNL